MIFERISAGGCLSYLVGCDETRSAALIDPSASRIDTYLGLAARDGLRLRYVIDTHTHADHFSASRELSERLGVPTVMHRAAPEPYAGFRLGHLEILRVGELRLQALHTPGHTADSMCVTVGDRVFTGDTLLIGGTGRTDLPTGDAAALHHSLFQVLLRLAPETTVYPAHDYKGRDHTTIGAELEANPRLQVRDLAAFVEMMGHLNLAAPTHLTEALRTNISGGRTVAQLLSDAAASIPFMSIEALRARLESGDLGLVLLDVREKEAFDAGHVPGARHLPRGQLELRVDAELPDPTAHILAACEHGWISTLAAATLRQLGYMHATALDGGLAEWRAAGLPMVG